ncbi:MAG: pirin family protein [Sphingobacteriales bacterium]|nr:pirin family protein [Sphingobacteriales bacterium]
MNRKDFIKKGLLGTSIFAASTAFGNVVRNNIDELQALDIIGFNHLPHTNSQIMSNTVLHRADTRGHANHGWLNSHHSFSFANYYNPERMHFGVLRVLNDDTVAGGMGFGTHPHDNMEIISIPLEGDLEHKDSMGNVAIIRKGDIQVMSAGTGIRHSEYNRNKDLATQFLQIWVFPRQRDVAPRYDQITLDQNDRHNRWQQVLSPNHDDEGVWIHQDAWFHLGKFDQNFQSIYSVKKSGNGLYVFVIKGSATIDGISLSERDGLGIWDTNQVSITADSQDAEILLMEVPMAL